MSEKTKLPSSLTNTMPWEKSETSIWLSTNFILRRNFSRYRFPQKISEVESHQILDLLKKKLDQSPNIEKPFFIKADELSPVDREYLLEHFLTIDGFGPLQEGQGFFIDDTQNFLACINLSDHLIIQYVEPTQDWKKTWEKLSNLDAELGKPLEYAYLPKFGYLTSDPTYCGTGLIVQAFLHLPAIINMDNIDEAFANEIDEDIFPRGMGGTDEEFLGDIVILQNKYTLGLTEDAILHSLHNSATKLMMAEETLRKHIQEKNNSSIKDKISRAYGLLSHSYQLQTKEVLWGLSLLKLGVHLGWVTNIKDQKINELFFKCRRGHLLFAKNQEIPQEEIPQKRAEYLHEEFKDVNLTI